jgi:hypothetical protein
MHTPIQDLIFRVTDQGLPGSQEDQPVGVGRLIIILVRVAVGPYETIFIEPLLLGFCR